MTRLLRTSGCKINLGLRVLRRRADGFHDIETVMYPVVGLHDIMEFIPGGSDFVLTSSGVAVDCPAEKHLCYKTWALLHAHFGIAGGRFHIHKMIPTGAGLGGGSANGAGSLELFNEAFSLGQNAAELADWGATLGSDVPFFCQGTDRPVAMLAEGRGEILTPASIDLTGLFLVILKPPVGISTAEAYAGVTPKISPTPLLDIVSRDISTWCKSLTNDFQDSIFTRIPILNELKNALYERGALYSAMSGSGSALFGIFNTPVDCADLPYYLHSETF